MDNNNPQVPTPAPAPQPVAGKTGGNEQSSSSNKMVLWFIIGLIIVIGLVGGIYFFLSKQQTTSQSDVVTQTPVPTPQENLEEDLNNINVDTATTSSDFNVIDQDLNQL